MVAKKILFGSILVLLFMPIIQKQFSYLIHVKSLSGVYSSAEKPKFSWSGWMNTGFQTSADRYVEEHIGFRSFFIRLQNQKLYSLYDKTHAMETEVGRQGHLFQSEYIRSIKGENYTGSKMIETYVKSLKTIQDSLSHRNIELLIVLVPGKPSIFPEFLPRKFNYEPVGRTNYAYYSQKFKEIGVHFIDLVRYYKQIKDTTKYPLFTKQGMHWSAYGSLVAADSLIRYIEFRKKINLPDYTVTNYIQNKEPIFGEYDLANNMNLLVELSHPPYVQPVLSFSKDTIKPKCSVLIIGDSFFYAIKQFQIPQNLFKDWEFWFYGKDLSNNAKKSVYEINYKEEVEKHDFVILFASEASLTIDKFPFLFTDGLTDYLK